MFLMLAVGSLAGLGASALGWAWWVQIIVASGVSLLLVLGIRPVLLRALRRGGDPTPSNVAALIGIEGRVVSEVNDMGGMVKLSNGETWTARRGPARGSAISVAATVIREGDRVVVTAIEGSTAVVTAAENNVLPSDFPSERNTPYA
ncbi:MAG: NfeD family protein [Microbacteriaceae bacterium]|nr:NfeD family protein [Microbacteriaceae bacterium]